MRRLQGGRARLIFIIFCFVAGGFASGCGRKDKHKEEDVVLKAYRLIDEQRDDEAIGLLEGALVSDPENYDYQVTLSSAYAHKAGIKIQVLYPVVEKTKNLESTGAIDDFDGGIVETLSRVSNLTKAFASLPRLSSSQASYLRYARHILEKLGDRLRPEDALYRAVLGLVLVNYIYEDQLVLKIDKTTQDPAACELNLKHLKSVSEALVKTLIEIALDYARARPDQASTVQPYVEKASQFLSNLTSTPEAFIVDETAKLFLKQAAIRDDFGKILTCRKD